MILHIKKSLIANLCTENYDHGKEKNVLALVSL